MANYLRQLRNDEKRATYALVGTLGNDNSGIIPNELVYNLLTIPDDSLPIRSYIVVTEAFPAGATLSVDTVLGDSAGESWIAGLDLTVIGATQSLATDRGAVYKRDNVVNATLNQLAIDGAVGKFKVVLEYTEQPVTTGKYTT